DATAEVDEHLVLQALRALDLSGLLLRVSHPPKARQCDRGHEDRSQDGDGARGRESVCDRVVEDGLICPRASGDERGCGVVSLSEGGGGGSQKEDDHEDVAEEEAVPHDPLELHEPAETLDEHKGGNGGRDHRHNRGAPAYQIPSAPVDQRVVARHDAEAREQRVDAQDGNEPAAERLPLEEERDDHHRDRGESEPGSQRPTLEDIVAARTGHGGGQARIDHGQEGSEGPLIKFLPAATSAVPVYSLERTFAGTGLYRATDCRLTNWAGNRTPTRGTDLWKDACFPPCNHGRSNHVRDLRR